MKINNDWDNYLAEEYEKPYYLQLDKIIQEEYNGENISICLQNRDLWKRFHDLTNEMM